MSLDVTSVNYVSCPGAALGICCSTHVGNDHMVISYVCQGSSVLLPQASHAPA